MTKCCAGLTTSLLFLSMDMEGCFRGASAKLLGKSDGWIESCGQVVLGECYVRCDKVRLSISIIRGLDSGLLMEAAPTADEKRRQENGGEHVYDNGCTYWMRHCAKDYCKSLKRLFFLRSSSCSLVTR